MVLSSETNNQLHKILMYAYQNSKYYKRIMDDCNINWNASASEILTSVPITTKLDLVNNYEHLLCATNKKVIKENTSGSTGIPITCPKTKAERIRSALSIWQKRKAIDQTVNHQNFLSVWGDTYIRNNLIYLSKQNVINVLMYILNKEPQWLSGPISVLEIYAKAIEQGHVKYNNCIKVIELIGEYATPQQRSYIEGIFNCKTTNLYGMRELRCIAYECPNKHLHVLDNDLYLEITANGNQFPGNNGEIILTSYNNLVMPLIRYNTNDLAHFKKITCDCGSIAPVIELCGGRSMEIIHGKNILGNVFFGRVTGAVNRKYPQSIESFKVEQVAIDHYVYYLSKGVKYTEEVLCLLRELIVKDLGKDTKIEFVFLDSIQLLATGKKRVFHTNLK